MGCLLDRLYRWWCVSALSSIILTFAPNKLAMTKREAFEKKFKVGDKICLPGWNAAHHSIVLFIHDLGVCFETRDDNPPILNAATFDWPYKKWEAPKRKKQEKPAKSKGKK